MFGNMIDALGISGSVSGSLLTLEVSGSLWKSPGIEPNGRYCNLLESRGVFGSLWGYLRLFGDFSRISGNVCQSLGVSRRAVLTHPR